MQAVVELAASFGPIAINRAYCNWQFFGRYRDALLQSAVELIQLFPPGASAKNGADIKLCLDATEDIGRFEHIGTVIIVGGDSDFMPVAQKIKAAGRTLIGIGTRRPCSWAIDHTLGLVPELSAANQRCAFVSNAIIRGSGPAPLRSSDPFTINRTAGPQCLSWIGTASETLGSSSTWPSALHSARIRTMMSIDSVPTTTRVTRRLSSATRCADGIDSH